MRFLILGLGIYGSNLARDLTNMGHEVIGADRSPATVDAIKEDISTAYIIDSSDETALSALPVSGVDLVIVAIGENFGASIKTVAILKKLGVKHIYARAADSLHRSILEAMKIDRILNPEQRAARDLSLEMALGHEAEVMKVSADTYIICFQVPDIFHGVRYSELNFAEEYGLTLVAASRPTHARNLIGIGSDTLMPLALTDPDLTVSEGDVIVCCGPQKGYRRLINHL